MRNPFAITPEGDLVTAASAAKTTRDYDYCCPSCSQRLQLLGRHSEYPGFPRWEHHAYEVGNCDKGLFERQQARVTRGLPR